ncbi:MAG TPA: methylisocitrate lyase [Atribacterota bacterium]|nr:methylisocitrate lyase [Atribacterota bacterium]
MKKTTMFRNLLKSNEVISIPGTYNALIAKLIEQKGFKAIYCTGGGISTSIYGLPDIGLVTLTEMVYIIKQISDSVEIPVISDADTGYGDATNVSRTIKEFEKIGVAGVHLEDQMFPKKCGHVKGKKLISTEEMVGKIRAAVGARTDPDFVIIARTDSRAIEGMDRAVKRSKEYIKAGADIIFPEALKTKDEFAQFASNFSGFPLLANMTEFGQSPYLTVNELKEIGYKIVIFPATTQRVEMKVLSEFLEDLKRDGTQKEWVEKMQPRKELYELIKYSNYIEKQKEFISDGGVEPI